MKGQPPAVPQAAERRGLLTARQAAPAIYEDGQYSPFTTDDINYVFGNGPIIGNGNAVEFQKDPNSGSPEYAQTVWFPRAL